MSYLAGAPTLGSSRPRTTGSTSLGIDLDSIGNPSAAAKKRSALLDRKRTFRDLGLPSDSEDDVSDASEEPAGSYVPSFAQQRPTAKQELTTADPPKPTGLESTDILDGLLGPSRKPGALVGRRAAMTSPKTGAASSTSPSRGASRPGAQGPPPAARNAAPNTAASPSPTPAASTAPRDKDDSWDLDIDLPDSGPASPQRKTSPHRNAERDVAGPGPSAKRPPDNEVVGTGNKGTDALGAADFGIESEGEEGSDGDNDAVIKAGQKSGKDNDASDLDLDMDFPGLGLGSDSRPSSTQPKPVQASAPMANARSNSLGARTAPTSGTAATNANAGQGYTPTGGSGTARIGVSSRRETAVGPRDRGTLGARSGLGTATTSAAASRSATPAPLPQSTPAPAPAVPPTGTSDADAQGEVARLRSELGSAQGTIAGLRAELEAARRTTVATEKREGTLRGELEEARAEAARLRKEATSAQAEAVDARREADEERRRMLADADAARVAALRERGELEDRLRSLEVKSREEIESMKKRHREELEAEKRAAVATARSLEHQLEGARALAEMAARVDSMSDVVKAAEGSLSQEMMRVVAEREQRIAAHEAQVRERERALERKEGEQRSMGAQLRELAEQLRRQGAEQEAAQHAARLATESERARLESLMREAETERAAARQFAADVQAAAERARGRAEEERKRLIAELDSERRAIAEERLEHLSQLEEARQSAGALRAEASALEPRVARARAELKELEEKLASVREGIAAERRAVAQQSVGVEEMAREVEERRREVFGMAEEVRAMAEEAARSRREAEEEKREAEAMRREVESARKDAEGLGVVAREDRERLGHARAELEEERARMREERRELARMRAEIAAFGVPQILLPGPRGPSLRLPPAAAGAVTLQEFLMGGDQRRRASRKGKKDVGASITSAKGAARAALKQKLTDIVHAMEGPWSVSSSATSTRGARVHAPRGNYHRQTRDTGTPDSGTSLGLPAPRGWDERRGRGGDQGATRRATPAADASWGMPWEMQGGATGSGPVGATGGPNRGQIRGGSARSGKSGLTQSSMYPEPLDLSLELRDLDIGTPTPDQHGEIPATRRSPASQGGGAGPASDRQSGPSSDRKSGASWGRQAGATSERGPGAVQGSGQERGILTRVGEAAGVAAYVGDVLSTPSAGGSSKKREREDRGGMGGGMGESGGSSASPRSVGDVYEIMLGIGSGGGERGSEGRGVEGEEVAEQAGSGEERPVVALGAGVGSDSESDDSSGVVSLGESRD